MGLLVFIAVTARIVAIHQSLLVRWEAAARKQAEQSETRANRSEGEAKQNLYESYLVSAIALQDTGLPGQRFDSLAACQKAFNLLNELSLSDEDIDRELTQIRTAAIAGMALVDVRPERAWPCPYRWPTFDGDFARYIYGDLENTVSLRRVKDNKQLPFALPASAAESHAFRSDPTDKFVGMTVKMKGHTLPCEQPTAATDRLSDQEQYERGV